MSEKLTALERFKKICSFERADDPFFWSVDSWYEAFERWVEEGMPVKNLDNKQELNVHLIGMQDQNEGILPRGAIGGMGKCNNPPWVVAIDPIFELKRLEETDTHVVERDYDGTIVERKKFEDASIPRYLDYPVKDKKTWDEYKKRLDPFSPGRWPEGWEIMTNDKMQFPLKKELEGKQYKYRDFPVGMNLMSLYGNPRNYMGVENISFAIFDDIKLVEEMIDWQAYLAYEMAKKVFDAGVTLEWVWIWEDMCFNKGPLVSPKFVKEFMVPRYRKVVDLLRNNGVDALILDCDGNIDELLPIWVDCGINATYPLECTSGMDARNVRKKFGKDLIIFGNIDKMALAKGKKEIDEEVKKTKALLK